MSLRVSLRKLIDRRDTNERRPLTITPFVSFNPHRKKKALHKTTSTDDKRLTNTLKRLGVNVIPGIINQLGPDNLAHLKKIAQAYQAGGDDVPAVENFEAGK